ncbi:hypothetical protein GV828_11155 [Flavobacterium sp. NST-5]|uniref:TonB C-terminal domain-containing protein n=1 Tax=Flavobacterium ichthyis TaxID=2698827 RepID=A0ABW9ZG62_9FLAO|nr:hypothetical protein [Flavobacterium ichthyis]NBL65758.1 hypothetical protein [Flavobacterium ichthyis]
MQKIYNYVIAFLFLSSYGQEKCTIFVTDSSKNPLESVLLLNLQNQKFAYSDSTGKVSIEASNLNDSLKLSLPSFEEKKLTFEDLHLANGQVILQSKPIYLDEIVIESNEDISFEISGKKKYYSSFISNGGALVSGYLHKKKTSYNKLKSVTFKFDKPQSSVDSKIRLVILEQSTLMPIKEYRLSEEISEEVILDVDSFTEFEQGKNYLIGFELVGNSKNEVKVLSSSVKNAATYIKPKPFSKWTPLEKNRPTFIINYKLTFTK